MTGPGVPECLRLASPRRATVVAAQRTPEGRGAVIGMGNCTEGLNSSLSTTYDDCSDDQGMSDGRQTHNGGAAVLEG